MISRLAPLVAACLLVTACGGVRDGDTTSIATTTPVSTSPVTTSPVTTSRTDTAPPTTSPIGGDNGPEIDPRDVAAPAGIPTRSADVVTIFDGDSLEISSNDGVVEARLVGINAPERDECLGDTARETLLAIVESTGRVVDVAEGDDGIDQFGRSLVYISASGVDINALLVATGNAIAVQSGHDRQTHYLGLMEQASADGSGIWQFGVCGPPEVADGDVVIFELEPDPQGRDDENLNGEWIVVRNTTTATVDVSGWTVRDESTANRYVFPAGAAIAPGTDVKLRTGCGNDSARERFWCSDGPVWSNGGDTALLMDGAGNVVDLLIYTS